MIISGNLNYDRFLTLNENEIRLLFYVYVYFSKFSYMNIISQSDLFIHTLRRFHDRICIWYPDTYGSIQNLKDWITLFYKYSRNYIIKENNIEDKDPMFDLAKAIKTTNFCTLYRVLCSMYEDEYNILEKNEYQWNIEDLLIEISYLMNDE